MYFGLGNHRYGGDDFECLQMYAAVKHGIRVSIAVYKHLQHLPKTRSGPLMGRTL